MDAITSIGDATFRIVNFDNGADFGGGSIGGDATINVSAARLSAATLLARINNLGGSITGDSNITFAIGGALATTGSAIFDVLQDSSGPASSVAISAGSYSIAGDLVARITDLENFFHTDSVSVSATNNLTVGGGIFVNGDLTAGGNITAAGGIFTPGAPNLVSAGGFIAAPAILAGELTAGGAITIDNSAGAFTFGIVANTITAGGNLNLINAPTITPHDVTSNGTTGFTPVDFTLTAANVISTAPTFPLLISNGSDTDPNVANGNPGNGGKITINITNAGLNIGPTDDLAQILANGGAFANNAILGGNGGVIDITATEDVNVNGNISATTGVNPTGTPAGNGGTVNVTTAGTITVNSVVQTSSDGSDGRSSAKGGNINLTSTRATGVAINIGNTGQLLALLNAAAPGPGGKVTILATGASSELDAKGSIQANRGTIDIRHTGANGEIYTGGSTDFLNAHADVVKVGALGANGVLTVGNGSLTADSVLKLYAPASNGTLNFIANVTISSGTDAILAANTLTIQPNVVVNVQGNGGPAQVFTNNANCSGFGGNNSGNGTFGGNGANNPLPLNQAPPFDGPPGG